MAGIVSASTRLPLSARAAAAGVVWSSSSSSVDPEAADLLGERARASAWCCS